MLVRDYYHRLTNRKKLIGCIRCRERLKPSYMNRHMQSVHCINIKHVCVWCLCPIFQRPNAYRHRIDCFEGRYSESQEHQVQVQPDNVWSVDPLLINSFQLNSKLVQDWLENMIPGDDDSISYSYPSWLSDTAGVLQQNLRYFKNKFPMDVHLSGFDPFLQQAYSFKENLAWVHVSVAVLQWNEFKRAVSHQCQKQVYFLPHWCMCAEEGEPASSHHRHVLLVMQKAVKNKFVTLCEKMFKGQGYEILHPDKHPCHLMNLIVYVGSAPSRNSEAGGTPLSRINHKNCTAGHYRINRPVVPNACLFAMLYLPLGVTHYMTAFHGRDKFWKLPIQRFHRSWQIECTQVSPIKGVIFPIARDMQFREIQNEFSQQNFIFVGQSIFTAERNEHLLQLDQYQWNAHQASHKNMFMDILHNFYFRPDSRQQLILTAIDEGCTEIRTQLETTKKLLASLENTT